MSNFTSTIGQKLGGVALPPTSSDLAEWGKNRWWWEQEAFDRLEKYDEAARNPVPPSDRKRPTLKKPPDNNVI